MCDKPTKQLDWDKPLQTKDGRDAVLLTKEYQSGNGIRYVVMVTGFGGMSMLYNYFPDGDPASPRNPTLRNKTRKVTKWYNLWDNGPGHCYYASEVEAHHYAKGNPDHVAIRCIEIEEPL